LNINQKIKEQSYLLFFKITKEREGREKEREREREKKRKCITSLISLISLDNIRFIIHILIF